MLYNDEKSLRSEPTRAPIPKDEWELDRDNIAMSDVLGEGAFGRVLKGTLTKDHSTTVQVAIKMLKGKEGYNTVEQMANLRRCFR